VSVGAVAAIVCFAAVPAQAAPGDLDTSFGGGAGWVHTGQVDGDHTYLPDGASGLVLQADGKIVTVGPVMDGGSDTYFGAFRFEPDGELDDSFGTNGVAAVDLGSFDEAHDVALQPDGKVILVGSATGYFTGFLSSGTAVMRFNPDGSVDESFGSDGMTYLERTSIDAVAVQSDGRIVLAGSIPLHPEDAENQNVVAVLRLMPDGRLDPSFSHDGKAHLDYGYGNDIAEAVVLQRGRIVVAGPGSSSYIDARFGIARFRRDGRVDRSFGNKGRRLVSFGRGVFAHPHAVATTPSGGLLVAGSVGKNAYHPDMAAVRLTPDGALDRGFGKGGRVRTAPGPFGGAAFAVGRAGRGGMLVAGYALNDGTRNSTSTWALVRYSDNGRLDRSFGDGGIVRTRFGTGEDQASALALMPGRALVAGQIYGSIGLARYLTG
jgi:uncharacterized delta-60 repeat protein